ncbi:ribosome maturation factor RimM [Treponema sp. UBA3813]|uniref:ribosome maturation factor RimM n=1 Tax=Treponema sp. UBA3813 TaxID=1947715 RepID=UPI0025F53B3C|nr:ribosome maturation factor RimM [Treponema sp. UBA3813]
MEQSNKNDNFIVGFVRASHGISGEFKVESTSGEYEHFASMKEVALRNGKTGEQKPFSVEYAEVGGRDLYLKLAGIDSPEAVQKYSKWEIVVPRKYACPLRKNEWYVEDLKNCALVYEGKDGLAENSAPIQVGTITDVMEGGSGNLLEVCLAENCDCLSSDVKYDSNGKIRTVYVPFKDQFIGKVDVKNKIIQLMHLWILE